MNASGIELLKSLLPGLERVLDDQQVSEIMINGPYNVWIEKDGRLDPLPAPALDSKALGRAAIHIARPLGLDPALSAPGGCAARRRLPGGDLYASSQSDRSDYGKTFWGAVFLDGRADASGGTG